MKMKRILNSIFLRVRRSASCRLYEEGVKISFVKFVFNIFKRVCNRRRDKGLG